MTTFIHLKSTCDRELLINVAHIVSIAQDHDDRICTILLSNTIDGDGSWEVHGTVSEILAVIEGDFDLVERQPVRRPEIQPGDFNL
jgi:hypothetical protein